LSRYAYLEVDKLSDDDLERSYEAVHMMGARKPLRQLAEEILRRPSMEGRVDFIHVHELLSELSADAERALVHLAEARRLGVAQGESPARWLVSEFELHLVQGDIQRAGRLLNEIQTRYLKEPGIAQSLMEVLTRVGLMTPDGPVLDTVGAEETPSLVAAGAGDTTSRLWTPGQESSAPVAREKESKLWVPGMD
jgi:hypothetical protein